MPKAAARHPECVTQGATIHELAIMFTMDVRDVRARLRWVTPRGRRDGAEYWPVHQACAYLIKLNDDNADLIDRILGMHPDSLPKVMTKEYYAGKNSQLTFLERLGEVWSTSAVVETASLIIRLIRQRLVLLPDQLEREAGLNERQRDAIQRNIDGTLEQMRNELGNHLRARRRNTRGKAFAHAENPDDGGIPDA